MQLIVAEKPSVARDLARVLGVRGAGRNAIEGPGHVITWCIGHLVELEEPAAYDGRWKAWRLETLPMIPAAFRLRPVDRTRDQLRIVSGLLRDRRFKEVVNACDAGREGELIFRYLYELAGSRLPVRRLWISSLTDEAVRAGFSALRAGRDYDPLADAARCRSEADWLVGMNATRALTVRSRAGAARSPGAPLYSVGRVQTPTLAIVVRREQEIRSFRPRDYWEIRGTFRTATAPATPAEPGSLTALWGVAQAGGKSRRTRLGDSALAREVVSRADQHAAASDPTGPVVERLRQRRVHEPAPLLFGLTSLQRTANRRFGLSAAQTLTVAQALYERHKLITYPRTDARHLPGDVADTLPKIFAALGEVPEYAPFADTLRTAAPPRSRRVFDDGKVHDHHAIIPTGRAIRWEALERDERRIFDLIARRFLGVFFPDAELAVTEVVIRVGAPAPAGAPALLAEGAALDEELIGALPPPPDRFFARGRVRLVAGWQAVAEVGAPSPGTADGGRDGAPAGDGDQALPPLDEGQRLDGAFEPLQKQTRPPPRHNEASLLGAMEYAGRDIQDEALRAAMRDTGLGTPATRAATIETLLKRSFILRQGKHLVPTELGIALIHAVPESVASLASPELTGAWEARLARVARGQERRADFMADINRYVAEMVQAFRGDQAARPPAQVSPPHAARTCPLCRQGTLVAGKRGWGCSRWRQGCAFVLWYQVGDQRISETELRDLIEKGRTRRRKWPRAEGGEAIPGRLVLDLAAPREAGAARFEPG